MFRTIEQIKAAYEHEHANGRAPRTADDIPLSYEAITPQWLSAVLCSRHPGARVTAHRLDAPDDGNSNRRRIFIEYNEAGRAARLPSSVFCKAVHKLANRISLGVSGAMVCEINFYNHVQPLLSIESPICYLATANEALNSIIMLEDLGGKATFCTHTLDVTHDIAQQQLSVLARLHGAFLESPRLTTSLAPYVPTWQEFFGRLDYLGFEEGCDKGFAQCESLIPARLFARRKEIWAATRASVARHAYLPHALLHGDTHLRNWYMTPDRSMGLNDWQTTTRGHWSRDVVYALTTGLTIEHRRQWERGLLEFYFERLQEAARRTLSFDGVFDNYRQQLMTVLAFWTSTINPPQGMPPDIQPRAPTEEFLRRIGCAIDDLESLDSFS